MVSKVIPLIHTLLPMGRASLANVLQAMGRNLRTLQRELAAERVEFRSLLAGIRDDLAEVYLRDLSLPVTAIAEKLGYASDTAFIRTCRTRHGETPGVWRE